jgi:hypothetical protein
MSRDDDVPCFSSDFSGGSGSSMRYSSSPEDCSPYYRLASEAPVANNDPYCIIMMVEVG